MIIISSQPFYVVKTGNRSPPCHRKGKMRNVEGLLLMG